MQWLQWLLQHLQTVRRCLLDNIETVEGLRKYGESLFHQKNHSGGQAEKTTESQEEFLGWIRLWKDEIKSTFLESEILIEQVQVCSDLVSFGHYSQH
jgi:hypothetical protein